MTLGPIELALEVASLLDRIDVPYGLGGSLASIIGEPRVAPADAALPTEIVAP